MIEVRLYGARYSVYTRIARLALEEKGVGYRFEEVDIFADDGPPAGYSQRHPFARIPAFTHGDLDLYETGAICRYIDEAFPGPPLQPRSPASRARMNQAISVFDSYAYRAMVWDVYVQRVSIPAEGGVSDETLIATALPQCETVLGEMERWLGEDRFLAGNALTLADLHAYPMICYYEATDEGTRMLDRYPDVLAWMAILRARKSVVATRFPGLGEQPSGE